MSFESAYSKVKELVLAFQENEEHYLSASYQESEVRQEYIDDFFIALGWDVGSKKSRDPWMREVRIEKSQKQEDAFSKKRADYAFYKAPNYKQEVFFVEAKKPIRTLRQNKEDYFQTAKYGYNSGTGISILFDFEEFVIIDCRYKPDKDVILSHEIKYYNYREFLDEEKFAEIYYIFSHEAVQAGKLQAYIENLPLPKKSAKSRQFKINFGAYKSLDTDFLEFIESSRLEIAQAVYRCNSNLKKYELTEAVQKILDRLVFIRFLEDKSIENDSIIELIYKSKYPWAKFVEESKRLNTKYNSIVFKEAFFDKADFIKDDNQLFYDIVIDFSPSESPYNFNYIPIEIIGNIYERFLGKTIDIERGMLSIDFKPAVRKAGGVFYTPTYIVDYIVNNTVGKLIENKTPKEISELMFADISCGSGSFLIGIFDYLIQYHTRWYNAHPDQAVKDGCRLNEDDQCYYLTIAQKKQILLNNVYGVDIDHQATEVAQMSLLLKLLENENLFTAHIKAPVQTTMLVADKILPTLSDNIKSGNTLIGSDYSFQTSLNLYDDEEMRKINVFDFEPSFPKVFRRGGFDAIVGNPPYVKEYTDRETFENIKRSRCNKYYQGKMDLWYFFVCYGIDLLRPNGLIGYIAPNNWVSNAGASIMRNKVIQDTQILELTDFGAYMVFQDASIQTMVMIFKKDIETDNYSFHYKHLNATNKTLESDVSNALVTESPIATVLNPVIQRAKYLNTFLKFGSDENERILDKIKSKANFELDGKKEAIQGIVGAPDKAFLVSDDNRKLFNKDEKKLLKRFYSNSNAISDSYIFYLSKSHIDNLDKEIMPNLYKKLNEYKTELNNRREVKSKQIKYFHLQWARNEDFFKIGDKIICPTRTTTNSFLFTNDEYYVSRACFVIKSNRINLKYLTGILNSKLVYYWLKNRGKILGNMFQIDKEPLLQIPIFKTDDPKLESEMIQRVDKMIELKKVYSTTLSDSQKDLISNQIKSLDYQIDQLVYSLYGLSAEEIEVIENG